MLRKQVVLITGSSRGIGAATARLFAEQGAAVAVNYYTNAGAAERVVQDITGAGGRAIAVQADVRVPADVAAMVQAVGERLGPIDTLVLNANITVPLTSFVESRWDDFAAKVMGELQAAFYCVQAVVPGMLAREQGCIIAVSSDVARHPVVGTVAHSTAKSALAATFIFALIGSRYIVDPVGAAAATDISLGSALAVSTMRVGFGAFPLGCALVALSCLVSPRRLRTGLSFVAAIFGVALVVRVFAILDDGTLRQSLSLLSAEAIFLTLSIAGLFVDMGHQRQRSTEAT